VTNGANDNNELYYTDYYRQEQRKEKEKEQVQELEFRENKMNRTLSASRFENNSIIMSENRDMKTLASTNDRDLHTSSKRQTKKNQLKLLLSQLQDSLEDMDDDEEELRETEDMIHKAKLKLRKLEN